MSLVSNGLLYKALLLVLSETMIRLAMLLLVGVQDEQRESGEIDLHLAGAFLINALE